MRPAALWTAWWVGFVALDWHEHKRRCHSTLSCVTRRTFHTDTRLGRTCFTLAYATGAWALHRHICKEC